ncbi:chemotaxis protein [Streptomyces sp. NRRL F-4489]|uniref:baeRF3 domain-containing protein n=1 Tax=Streptomyces sp. NRRL F-4489 TaxID=1609095 RepID=UPI000748CA3D|nr:chemotaxis protein [Streptomyces sp. NRRL F-4489]KUL33480.1 chemotaxis protein [Streptomyces sp. NRRL F-4489]
MHAALSSADLAKLRRPRPYPAVTVLVPTHRREPDNAQDRVLLRNMIAQAKERLRADPQVTRERRYDVGEQLDRAAAEVDLTYAEDGLALFAAPGEHQVWSLGRAVPGRVVVSDTFLTRNLVAAHAAERPYWVLALSAGRVSLWSGTGDRITEARRGGFPRTRDLSDPDPEDQLQVGNVPSVYSDEHTRKYLREADAALAAVLRADPRPLYVVGGPVALALLDDAGSAVRGGPGTRNEVTQVPQAGLSAGPPDAIWQAIRPYAEKRAEAEVADVLAELDRARGRRAFAAGVDEIRQNADTGRVALLAVEENYRQTVRDAGGHLMPAEPGEPDAVDDIVDEIVERSLDTGAEVRFVPDGALAEVGGIAGALRY